MRGGEFVSTRAAKSKTVADALAELEATLDPNNTNHRKEINRIRQILDDPIAARSVAGLRKTDIANYRDQRVLATGPDRARLRAIDSLPKLRRDLKGKLAPSRRAKLIMDVQAIQRREGIREAARTTVTNKTQLISRALALMGETIDGVPDVSGREAVAQLRTQFEMSERRATTLVGADRTMIRYRSRRPEDAALRARLRDLAHQRHRFGYRRLHVLLRREGEAASRNKVYRLYRAEGLAVR